MKKINKILALIISVTALFCMVDFASALDVDLSIGVTMPVADSINVSVSMIKYEAAEGVDDVWEDTDRPAVDGINFTGEGLPFEANSEGVYGTGRYYAVEVGPSGGGWGSNLSIGYTSTGIAGSIADHSTMTVMQMTYIEGSDPSESNIYGAEVKKRLDGVASIPLTTLEGHWMRFYIGLAQGDEDETLSVTPFTAATPPGEYSGTLTFTYVVT